MKVHTMPLNETCYIPQNAIVSKPQLGVRVTWHVMQSATPYYSVPIQKTEAGALVPEEAVVAAQASDEVDDWVIPVVGRLPEA